MEIECIFKSKYRCNHINPQKINICQDCGIYFLFILKMKLEKGKNIHNPIISHNIKCSFCKKEQNFFIGSIYSCLYCEKKHVTESYTIVILPFNF